MFLIILLSILFQLPFWEKERYYENRHCNILKLHCVTFFPDVQEQEYIYFD